jgi:hypothetical protein
MRSSWLPLVVMSLMTLTHAHGQIFNVQFNAETSLEGSAWTSAISPLAYTGTTWTEYSDAGASDIPDSNDDSGSTVGFTLEGEDNSSNNGSSAGTAITQSVVFGNPDPLKLTFTGLDDSKTYNIFLVSAYDGGYGGSFTIGSSPAEVSAGDSALTDFVAGENYVEFTNVTPIDKQIVINETAGGTYGGYAMLNGFQLEVAPEPSTYAMLFGGLGMLIMVSRLRRKLAS